MLRALFRVHGLFARFILPLSLCLPLSVSLTRSLPTLFHAGMSRIYVGNLPTDIRERDVEDLFFKYGRIVEIDLKVPQRPPAFAFVTFEHRQDAESAARGRDGVEYEGMRLRCVCGDRGIRRLRSLERRNSMASISREEARL